MNIIRLHIFFRDGVIDLPRRDTSNDLCTPNTKLRSGRIFPMAFCSSKKKFPGFFFFIGFSFKVCQCPMWPRPILRQNNAILNCRYGLHEKSWKIELGLLHLKSRQSPHCWARRNSRESTPFHFGPVERDFPDQRNDEESSIAACKRQYVPPAGSKRPPAGTQSFSSKLFDPAPSSLG